MLAPHLQATSNEMLALDFMRFYASAAIVIHHSHQFFWSESDRPRVIAQSEGLALFVDLFFVISGFVIAYVYTGRIGNLRQFARIMQRRVGRLFPLHLLTFLLSVAMWAGITRLYTPNHVPSWDQGCMALTAGLLHALIPCGNGDYFNGVNWSIAAEMVMYALFPFLAIAARRSPRLALVGTVLVIAGMIYRVSIPSTEVGSWTLLYAPLRALPGFCLGIVMHANRDVLAMTKHPRFAMWTALVGATSSGIMGAPTYVALPLFYAAGVAAIAVDLRKDASPFIKRMAPLGQLTYSIYLWHGFFITVLLNAVADKLMHGNFAALALCTIACFGGIMVWSYLSWRYFETPARQWVDSLFGGRKRSVSASLTE